MNRIRQLAGRALAIILPLLLVMVIFDRRAANWTERLMWCAMLLGACWDTFDISRQRVRVFGGVLALALGGGVLISLLGENVISAWKPQLRYFIPLLWAALAWLYAGYVGPLLHRRHDAGARPSVLLACCLATTLLAFCIWAYWSAISSINPKMSMKLLGGELLPYAAIFLLIPRLLLREARLSHNRSIRTCWLIVCIAAIGMAITLLLPWTGAAPGLWLMKYTFFRVDADAPDALRLQYLFQHHNRAGVFAATAVFIALAGIIFCAWRRALAGAACVSAAFALPYTTTRGALIAAVAGGCLMVFGYAVARGAKRAIVALLILVAGLTGVWLLTAGTYKSHISRVLSARQYESPEGGSISARLVIWKATGQMIADRPLLGFGYGFENFEPAARRDHPGDVGFFKGAVHAHNQWLETAAETGIPGAVMLLTFTLLRFAWLAGSWWRVRADRSPLPYLLLVWLALELTLQLYGLTNYALRRGLGLYIYSIWSGSVVLCMLAANRWKRDPQAA